MEQTAMSLLDRLPPWLQVLLALAVILIVLSPVLVTYIARTVVEWKKFWSSLERAREKGISEVVKLLWAEGQNIKVRLDRAGLSRGDFPAQLRQAAKALLIDHGLPVELVDVVLDRARIFHKATKTERPQLVPGAVMELNQGWPDEGPQSGEGGSTPKPSSPASEKTGLSGSLSEIEVRE